MGASAAKLLVYYHPGAPNAADQEQLVADVAGGVPGRGPRAVPRAALVRSSTAGRLTGEARREVVIETARRLTPLGADVLKAEFPYDAVGDRPGPLGGGLRRAGRRSTLPWVLLSGGVDDATFEGQVAVACGAGASGVLVGRSVWAEAARLARLARDASWSTTGRARLARLVGARRRPGGPWRAALARRPTAGPPGPGWYARY